MAAGGCFPAAVLLVLVLSSTAAATNQVKSSQVWSLLRLRRLLGHPPVLASWTNNTDPCSGDPSPSLTVVCYGDGVSQLHIAGADGSPPLPRSFSVNSFFTTLTRLPNLKVLSLSSLGLWGSLPGHKLARLSSLEILNLSSNFLSGPLPGELSSLVELQSLILDHNMFSGEVPAGLGQLSRLAVVSVRNNSLSGELPESLANLEGLRVLVFSANNLSGGLPDLTGLTNLQVLDVGDNRLGPVFPELGKKVATVVLRNNTFTGGLPTDVTSYHLLQKLDISHNRFVGPFPPALLSLPSIRHLDIAGNRFTGLLFSNLSCNDGLEFVDFSFNLLTGNLPACLARESTPNNVSYLMNCLSDMAQPQHPYSFCRTQALAVGVIPTRPRKGSSRKTAVAASVAAAAMATVFLALLGLFTLRKLNKRNARTKPPRRLVEHASNGYPSKLLSDARYISQTIKLGALGIPSYRSFSLEELEAATNGFETSAFLDEGSHGEMPEVEEEPRSRSQNFTRYIELFSKLRHQHLVSALGHCFEYYLDDSSVSRVFLVFEYVTNGTLRSNLCVGGHQLTWSQRISAAIGVAKGIQFLHAGIIPGLFANGVTTTNVVLDHNLVAKISSYNLPIIADSMRIEGFVKCIKGTQGKEKMDIYDFGVILLEVISGQPVTSTIDVNMLKDQFEASITADGAARQRSMVDVAIRKASCDESLIIVMEICIRCLSAEPLERPSIEDILWNLQFAAQIQDDWRGDAQSGSNSPPTLH
ncbi:unnamed protein product [Spirodela intermedia]|uniref:Protein kinase domain-containing protein n=1 Tax=Spirodela intermedia TaxID=51605 RepID=A0A7I8IA37_SPIIN|nr:unnamed protein product [Spirodela intermedia]CAA6653781.1 unnamed protein product [Spirodela intermedia]